MISRKHCTSIVLFFLLFLSAFPLFSQDQQKLEKERKKIEADIKYTNDLLEETKKSKNTTVYKLRLIGKRIDQRNNLITTLRKEIDVIKRKIRNTEDGIDGLN